MLRLVIRKDEQIKIGDDIVIKSMSDGRVSLAIDAPKEMKIERIEAENFAQKKSEGSVITDKDGKKKYVVVNNSKYHI